jgi:polyferredoxin
MDSFNFPRGLIRYDSEKNLASAAPQPPRLHWKRLKVVGYGLALVVMVSGLGYSIATRSSYDRAISQVRQPLYVVLSNGDIRNRYQVRITNKASHDQTYAISARGLPAGALDLGHFSTLTIKPGHSGLVLASVRLPPVQATRIQHFDLLITPLGQPAEIRAEAVRFDSPGDPT